MQIRSYVSIIVLLISLSDEMAGIGSSNALLVQLTLPFPILSHRILPIALAYHMLGVIGAVVIELESGEVGN